MGSLQINQKPNWTAFEQSYFHLIKNIHRHDYLQNQENKNNVYISKIRKEFATNPKSNTPQNEFPDYIHWLDYLYSYLGKQSSLGVLWAENLIALIDKEYFLYENKYQSWLFFKDFYLRTVPRCFWTEEQREEMLEINASIEHSNSRFRRNTTNSQHESDIKNYNELSVTSNLGGSFLSMDTSELAENDPNLIYKHGRIKVKEYIAEMKDQWFNNSNHPIRKVIRWFSDTFSVYVNNEIKSLNQPPEATDTEEEYTKRVKQVSDLITNQLQKFIIKIQKAVWLFYCECMDYQWFENEKDELMNLMTGLVFKSGKIYENMHELYGLSWKSIIKGLENKCFELKNVKPQHWGIQDKFCWNAKTWNWQKTILFTKKKEREVKAKQEIEKRKILTQDSRDEAKKNDELIKIIEMKIENIAEVEEGEGDELSNMKNDISDANDSDSDSDSNTESDGQIEEVNEEEHWDEEEKKDEENAVNNNTFHLDNINININRTATELKQENNKVKHEKSIDMVTIKSARTTILQGTGVRNPEISSDNNNINNIVNKTDNIETCSHIDKIIKKSLTKTKHQCNPKNKDLMSNVFNPLNLPRYSQCWPNPIKLRALLKAPNTHFNVIRDTITRKNKNIAHVLQNKQVPPSYTPAIRWWQSVKKFKTPFEKMMIIATISDEITECVSDFWKDMSTYIKNSFLDIESDELMTIFWFILIKSQMPEIAIHAKLIKNFTTSTTRGTMIGYYYTTLEATIAYWEGVKDKKEIIKKNEMKLARWSVLNLNSANNFTNAI